MIRSMSEDEERVEYLRSRIVEAFQSQTEGSANLGSIAIEIILLRNEYQDAKDERSKKILAELRDLEKSLVSLYMLGKLGVPSRKEWTRTRDYTIFHKGNR